MPNLQTVANVVALDTKVLHNHVFIASQLGVRRQTRRIDGADDFFVYVNVAKAPAVGTGGATRRGRALPPFFLGRDIPRWRTGRLAAGMRDSPLSWRMISRRRWFSSCRRRFSSDDGFHEIQHFADDFADAGVSQGIHVQAKLLHVFSEVGGTHDTGILCLHSPEKLSPGMLALLANRRIRKSGSYSWPTPYPCLRFGLVSVYE